MTSHLLQHLYGDHPRALDDLAADFARMRKVGCRCDGLPATLEALTAELNELGRAGLVKCGPLGWEPTFARMPVKQEPQKALF